MYDFHKIGLKEHTIFEADEFLFNVFEVRGYTMRAHWHNHLELIYANKGSSVIGINGLSINLIEGEILFIFGGTVHSITNEEGEYEAILIGDKLLKEVMYDDDYRKMIKPLFIENTLTHITLKPSDKDYPQMYRQVMEVMGEFNEKLVGYRMMIKSKITEILLTIVRTLDIESGMTSKENSTVGYIKIALDYIENHYREKITLKDMSQATHLSEQYFGRIFKAYTHKTFIEYLTNYRLEMSNWYLRYTMMPITSIPDNIGICNSNYFSRIYKEHYNQTPRQTRKKYSGSIKKVGTY